MGPVILHHFSGLARVALLVDGHGRNIEGPLTGVERLNDLIDLVVLLGIKIRSEMRSVRDDRSHGKVDW